MTKYYARRFGEAIATARAETIHDAADILVRKIYGRKAVAIRETGDRGKSGYFQGYVYDEVLRGQNSVGSRFHVTDL